MPVVSNNYWKRFVCAPDHVPRAYQWEEKACFFIKREFNPDLDCLWVRICWATESGHLGYYCGYSDDSQVIAVHVARPFDLGYMATIKENIKVAGGHNIKFRPMRIEQDEKERKVTLADFEHFDGVVTNGGEVITKQDYLKNPGLYRVAW